MKDLELFVYNVRKTFFYSLIATTIFLTIWIIVAVMNNVAYFKAVGILTGVFTLIDLVCWLILDGITWHFRKKGD